MLSERGKTKINDLLNAIDGLFDDDTVQSDMSSCQMKIYIRDKFLIHDSRDYAGWWISHQ